MADLATLGYKVDFKEVEDAIPVLNAHERAAKGVADQSLKTSQALAQSGQAHAQHGAAIGANSSQMMAMMHVARSMTEQMAMGVSPVQALTAQFSHLSYIFTSGGGLTSVLGAIGGLLTPAVLGFGSLATVVAGAGISYARFTSQQRELEAMLASTGRATGLSIGGFDAMAEAAAKSGDISVHSAKNIAAAYASTGKIGADVMRDLTSVTQHFATATGTDVEKATKTLAATFAEPAKGALALGESLGMVDDRTAQYVRTLEGSNRHSEAQNALYKAMEPRLDTAIEKTTALGRAWKVVSTFASDAADSIGHAIDRSISGGTLEDQLRDAQNRIRTPGRGGIDNSRRTMSAADTALVRDLEIEIQEQQRRRYANLAVENRNKASLAGGAATRAAFPEIDQLQQLKDRRSDIATALQDPNAEKHLADINKTKEAMDAYTQAIETHISPAEKNLELEHLAVQALEARSPAQKAVIAQEQTRIQLAGQVMTAEDRYNAIEMAGIRAQTEAQHALTEAQEQRLRTAQNAIGSAALESAQIGKSVGQVAELRANWQAWVQLNEQAARTGMPFDEKGYSDLVKFNHELGRTVQLAAEAKLHLDIQQSRDDLGLTDSERSIQGRLRSVYGNDFSSIAAQTDAANMRLIDQLRTVKDYGDKALDGFLSDLEKGTSIGETFANMGKNLLSQMAHEALHNAWTSVFATGGPLDSLFGIHMTPTAAANDNVGTGAHGFPFGAVPLPVTIVGSIVPAGTISVPSLTGVPMGVGHPGDIASAASSASLALTGARGASRGSITPYVDTIRAAAAAHGVSPAVLAGLLQQESGFRADAVGDNKTAIGIAQLHAGAAHDVGVTDRWDATQSINGAAAYLAQQQARFGNVHTALAAYNQGPGGDLTGKGNTYANSVLNNSKAYEAMFAASNAELHKLSTTVTDVGATAAKTTSGFGQLGNAMGTIFGGSGTNTLQSGGVNTAGGGFSLGGLGSWLGSLIPSLFFHDGGMVGAGGSAGGWMPASTWAHAQRFHSGFGTVGAGERPIIARDGELVGWPEQFAQAFGGRGGSTVHVGGSTLVIQGDVKDRATVQQIQQMLNDNNQHIARETQRNLGDMNQRYAQHRQT